MRSQQRWQHKQNEILLLMPACISCCDIYHFWLVVHSNGHIHPFSRSNSFTDIASHHKMCEIALHDVAHSSLTGTSRTTRRHTETTDINTAAGRHILRSYISSHVCWRWRGWRNGGTEVYFAGWYELVEMMVLLSFIRKKTNGLMIFWNDMWKWTN